MIEAPIYSFNETTGDLVVSEGTITIPTNYFSDYYFRERTRASGVPGKRITGTLYLPDSLEYIRSQAFQFQELTDVKFGNSLRTIEAWSFEDTYLSGELILPDSVFHVGKEAFYDCDLDNLVLGKSLEYIGSSAFEENTLKSITFNSLSKKSSLKKIKSSAFRRNDLSGRLSLPRGLVEIGETAFEENELTALDIPNSVDFIGKDAFLGNRIRDVELPYHFKDDPEIGLAFDTAMRLSFREKGERCDVCSVDEKATEEPIVVYADIIIGSSKRDRLKASSSSTMLKGMNGNDVLIVSKKDDLLDGGGGNDKLKGGKGADAYVLSSGKDKFIGFKVGEGDIIQIDSDIIYQVASGRKNVKITHDNGVTIVNNALESDIVSSIEIV